MRNKFLSLLLVITICTSMVIMPPVTASASTVPEATAEEETLAVPTPLAEDTESVSEEPSSTVPSAEPTLADEGLFTYTVSGESATITDVDASIAGNIIIPPTLGGVPVTSIGSSAFYGCTGLTSVTIPDSVTSIGSYAFSGCSGLTSVTIPSSVTSIGSSAFYNCYKLIEVYNLSSLTITKGSSSNGYVGYYAKNVYTATSVESKLITAGDYLFYNDNGTYYLMGYTRAESDITLPASVNGYSYAIYQYAFYGKTNLVSVTIPSSVTSIGSSAFSGCTGLTAVHITDLAAWCGISFGGSSANPLYYAKKLYADGKLVTELVIPDGATSIGSYAFYGCTGLTSVTIPNSVTSIGSGAFSGCTGLTSVTIPASVTSIGSSAFSNCYKLIEVYNLSALTITVGETGNGYAGYYAKNVYTATSGESKLITAGSYLFYNNNGTYYLMGYTGAESDITLPESVNGSSYSIYTYAFYKNTNLISVTIPSSVTSIGDSAFEGCTRLAHITLPFVGANKSAFDQASHFGYIFGCDYWGSDRYSSFEHPSGQPYYHKEYNDDGDWSYYVYSIPKSLKTVVLTGSTSIQEQAFQGCSILSITLPSSLRSIESSAFWQCSKLIEVCNLSTLTITAGETGNGYVGYYAKNVYTATSGESKLITAGDYLFYNDNGTYYLMGYMGSESDITLPANVDGQNYSIRSSAFEGLTGLSSVVIPSGVTSIGSSAFSGCTGLTSVTISDGVMSIGGAAFSGCARLSSITIPSSVTSIGLSAFSGCTSLTSVIIPDSVASIGSSAFRGCTGLSSVTIPASVTRIDSYTFSGCTGLNAITFAEGSKLETIGSYAFSGCTSLSSITIPSSVTTIESYAFEKCTALSSVTIPASVTSIWAYAFEYCMGLTAVYTADLTAWCGISFGGYSANPLYYAKNLYVDGKLVTELVIPEGVTKINSYAFSGCTSLTSVTVPSHVTSIGSAAFLGCTGLTAITLPFVNSPFGSIFGASSYYYNDDSVPASLKTVVITGGKSIASYAFYQCANLTSIILPESITSIGSYAFYGCTGLTSIAIPASVTSISSFAFSGCSGLTSIALPFVGASATATGSSALFGYIFGTSSYTGGTRITQYYSASSYTVYCIPTGLTRVVLTGGTSIPYGAFYGCSQLTSISIPATVTSIGASAFSGCTELTNVHISDVGAWCSISFGDTYSYPMYYAEKLYLNGSLVGGVLTIPEGVTSIPAYAFHSCTALTAVTIPSSVTSIGDNAFSGCRQLIEVYNLSGLSISAGDSSHGSVAYYAKNVYTEKPENSRFFTWNDFTFYNDNGTYYLMGYVGSDRDITLPASINGYSYAIYEYAFYGNTNLTSVTVPSGVTAIGAGAFGGCSSLESITLPFVGASPAASDSSALFGYIFGTSSYTGGTATSQYSIYWWDAVTYYIPTSLKTVVITDGTSIPSGAFCDCLNLTSIIIPSSVTSIGSGALRECSNLTSITIPSGVTSIGSDAFEYCNGLTSITIPSSVTSIGSYAFSGCTGLTAVYITDPAAWCNISFGSSQANPLYCAKNLYVDGKLVTDLVIPEGVTSIGSYAFSGYTGLTSVTIPSSVTSIGTYAFEGCTGITSITISEGVQRIERSAFYGCTGLTSITVPSSVVSIGDGAFEGCTSLESITLPFVGGSAEATEERSHFGYIFGWEYVDQYSAWHYKDDYDYYYFNIPSSLEKVVITGGSSIGRYAFQNCSTLTSVTLPASLKTVSYAAFSGCTGLSEVHITDLAAWVKVKFVDPTASPLKYAKNLYLNGTLINDLVIPAGVTGIGDYAFMGCAHIKSVTFPSSLRSIGIQAFVDCSGLTSVVLPSGVVGIAEGAFKGCTGLTSITLPFVGRNAKATGYQSVFGVIFGCSETSEYGFDFDYYDSSTGYYYKFFVPASLKTVVITGGTSIGDDAFNNCSNLTLIEIPSGVTSIGDFAFWGCSSLTSITIPAGVTSIGAAAFWGCVALESITVAPGNTKYHSAGNCLIETESKTLLRGCKNSIIPADGSVTSIAAAFQGCAGLSSITIPSSVTSIGYDAFSGCTGLTSVTIPSSVTSIGYDAFSGCTGLTAVHITDLAAWCGISFGDSSANPLYYAKKLYADGKLVTELVIPESVTKINSDAFSGCTGLTSVTIPDSVTSIGYDAFYGCTGLTAVHITDLAAWCGISFGGSSANPLYYAKKLYADGKLVTELVIPESVTKINSSAFYGCTGLTSVTIPDSVTSIGSSAFSGCTGLTSVTIPSSVTSIGYDAFSGCTGLTSVTIPDSVTSIGSSAFYNCYKLIEVYNLSSLTITKGSSSNGYVGYYAKNVYAATSGESKLITAGDYLFYNDNGTYYLMGYTGAESDITLPASVNGYSYAIYQYAFYGNTNLTSVTVPSGVTAIGAGAFGGCSSLESITLPFVGTSATATGSSALFGAIFGSAHYSGGISVKQYYSSGSYAFYHIPAALKTVVITGSASIPYGAFYGCSQLASISIPATVTSIGSSAFSGCTGLTSVTIPDSVTSIGSSAFYNCYKLIEVYNLSSLTITKGSSSNGYVGYYAKNVYTATSGESKLITAGDYLFYNDNGTYYLMGYTGAESDITLPASVNGYSYVIYQYAFYGNTNLVSVTIPSSVTSIGSSAFYGCSNLWLVTIESAAIAKAVSYSSSCGYLCSYAKTVRVPASMTAMGSYITENFTEKDTFTKDGVLYQIYSNHSHKDGAVWAGAVCTLCGLENPCVGDHDMQGATCTTPAVCTRCGAEGDALGHLAEDPLCTMPSICERCDEIVADALGHDLLDATCTDPIKCSRCSYKRGTALGHDMQDATCLLPSTCSRCGHTAGETLAHDMTDADCLTPSTCTRCGKTEGEALGHDMTDATCLLPSTCTRCGHIEGGALGHDMADVTCLLPSTCTRCGHTEGEALGHDMQAATCTLPSTCSRCEYTEGESLGHDMSDATCTEAATCARCGHTEGDALGHTWSEWKETLAPTYISDGCETRVCGHDSTHTETRVKYAPKPIEEWTCGESIIARLYPDTVNADMYTLHIFGTGAMYDYTAATMPWVDVLDMIMHVRIYEGVTSIGDSAFRGCVSLTTATIANSVLSIGASAFRACNEMVEISSLASVTEIGSYAFYRCTALASLTVGEGATLASVGTYAFSGCNSLKLLRVENQAAWDGITDYDVYGFLLAAVETICVKADLVGTSAYIAEVFSYTDTVLLGSVAYTVYSFHSHATEEDTWDNGLHGMTCTVCGLVRDFAGEEAPLYALGDVNGDGVVDIADIVAVINVASGMVFDPSVYPGDTDLNADGVVDIADIVAVINIASGVGS